MGCRFAAALVAIGCLVLLGTASGMTPSEEGRGTHTQLGLPACSWPEATGAPCPSCGMTTSFAHAAEGDLVGSVLAQPFGALLAIATASAFWLSSFTAATGARVHDALGNALRPRIMWVIAALALAAWAYKIAVHVSGTG